MRLTSPSPARSGRSRYDEKAGFQTRLYALDAVPRGKPCDVAPLFKNSADPEVIERVTGKAFNPASTVGFYYSFSYDYVYIPLNLSYPIYKSRARDTAELSRGERVFQDTGRAKCINTAIILYFSKVYLGCLRRGTARAA
jgi:hypothetical protein